MIPDLQKELERLKVERDDMHERNRCVLTAKAERFSLRSATKLPIEPPDDEVKGKLPSSRSSTDRESDAAQSPPEHSSNDHDKSGSGDKSRSRNRTRGNRSHPPGFKELCGRVEKFSGKTGDCDFELCMVLKKLPRIVAGMTTNGYSGSHGLSQALPRPLDTEH